jgi:3-oxoacyl-[acyl-carrier protein] reductase
MRSVVVTGGSRGIGLGIAKALVRAGYNAIIVARNVPGPALEKEIAAQPNGGWGIVNWDLSEVGTFSELAHNLRDRFGPVYGLVNNAGIGLSGILSITSDAKIDETIRMNVLSPVSLTKHLVGPMMAAREGRIVNISSIVASTGYPGLGVYSATKASMIGFTRSLAREVGSLGITVNAVAPGFIDTEMTNDLNGMQREQIKRRSAMQRMATVDDVACAVEFLMSDRAANVTGTVLTVDAGNTA